MIRIMRDEKVDEKHKTDVTPRDHLANERTFLAWIRTSISLMGFGFVIVKFSLFLKQISLSIDPQIHLRGRGFSAVIGVIMVALGAIGSLLSYLRYRRIERQLNNNIYFPNQLLTAILTIFILIGSILLMIYLIPQIR